VKNDFNSQPGLAALLDQAKSDRQLSAIGVYGYWQCQYPLPFLGNREHSHSGGHVVGQAKS